MSKLDFTDENLTYFGGLTTAEELLVGLITQQKEIGAVGNQLIYLLLGAGIAPSMTFSKVFQGTIPPQIH